MARSTTSQTLPGTDAWFIFYGVWCVILLGALPLICALFVANSYSLVLTNPNSIFKLIIFLTLNYCLCGFWVVFVKLKEYWEESFITKQQLTYLSKPAQQLITFELDIPVNYKYNPSNLVPFFFYMGNAFKSTNISKSTKLNYGRAFSDVSFDFVIENGVLQSYITVQKKKVNETVEMFKRFFPEIQMKIVDCPYLQYSSGLKTDNNWNTDFEDLVGYNLGNFMSNIFPTHYGNDSVITNLTMDMLLRALRDTFPDQKIALQQVFRFDPSNSLIDNMESQQEFAQYRQSLFNKYTPKGLKDRRESDAFPASFPESIRNSLDTVAHHFETAYIGYSFIVVGFCKSKNQSLLMTKKIESFLRNYTSSVGNIYSSNYIDIKYLVSNKQSYSSSNTSNNTFKSVVDNYIMPTKFGSKLESLIAPLYEKYFYPNENNYRTKLCLSSLVNRNYAGQWNGDWNITSPLSIPSFWQLPSLSLSGSQIDILVGGNDLNSHKSSYEDQ